MVGRIERGCPASCRTRRWQFLASLIVSAVLVTACVSKGPTSPEQEPGTTDGNTPPPRPSGPGRLTAIVSSGCSPSGGPPITVYMDGNRFGTNENPLGTLMPGQSLQQLVLAGIHSMEAFSANTILVKGPDDVVVSSNQNTDWHIC
jgi:hypothetical protein